MPIIRKYTDQPVELVSCKKVSGEITDLMEIGSRVPIASVDEAGGFQWSTLGAILIGKPFPSSTELSMFLVTRSDFKNMVDEIDRAYPFETIAFSTLAYEIELHNDTSDSVEFFTGGHFVNERAVDRGAPLQIKRRQSIKLKSSNVKGAFLKSNGRTWLGFLSAPNSELSSHLKRTRNLFTTSDWQPSQ